MVNRYKQGFITLFVLSLLWMQAEPQVTSMWSGGVTANGATLSFRFVNDTVGARASYVVSTNLTSDGRVFFTDDNPNYATSAVVSSPFNNGYTHRVEVTGLTPLTTYYYAVQFGGVQAGSWGQFQTFTNQHLNFSFALGSCADTGSNNAVFEAIRKAKPLFFLHTGDLHYSDIDRNDVTLYRNAYDQVLASPRQSDLYRNVPIAYVWDDHDFGPNDADRTNPGSPAARQVYQEYVPHYPLAAGTGLVPIYQTWTVGKVAFVMTDLRSEKDPASNADGPSKTTMGLTQKNWLKQTLLAHKAAGAIHIVWVITNIWIGNFPTDSFASYEDERTELATFIYENGLTDRLFVVSGDTHMVAFDDGDHNRYALKQEGKGFPVFQAGPLDRRPSKKGGPYSHGCFAKRGQYGKVTVTTNMDMSTCLLFEGFNEDGHHIFSYDSCDPPPEDLCTPLDLVVFVSVVGVIVSVTVLGILACVALCLYRRWRQRKMRTHQMLEDPDRQPMREFTGIDASLSYSASESHAESSQSSG